MSPQDSCTVEQAILLVYRAVGGKTVSQAVKRQADLDRATIQGLEIGTPFADLPPELRSELEPVGEPFDGWPGEPGKEIARRYQAPGIEIITSEASEPVLKRVLEGQDKEYLLKYYGSEDWKEVYEREKGREYVDTVILTGDGYRMVSGLKVGDSRERVEELGYDLMGETYEGSVGFDGSTAIYMAEDQVERIEVWDCIGRRVGAFMDP